MHKAIIQLSEHAYDFLLKFYPSSYRKEFGSEMKYVFSESLKDTQAEYGDVGLLTLWARTISDAGKSLIVQHFEEQKGGGIMTTKNNDVIMQNKVFGWLAGGTALILSLPLIAMQFDGSVDWTLFDCVVMGILLFGSGSLFVIIARSTPQKYRMILGVGFLLAVLTVWVHLAVGIVDTWPLAGS